MASLWLTVGMNICSSWNHKRIARRLCWAGEVHSWVRWLWLQGVWWFGFRHLNCVFTRTWLGIGLALYNSHFSGFFCFFFLLSGFYVLSVCSPASPWCVDKVLMFLLKINYVFTKEPKVVMCYRFSRRYGYDWKREEANKNLLRTHTTAVSSRMLYALAQVFEGYKFGIHISCIIFFNSGYSQRKM